MPQYPDCVGVSTSITSSWSNDSGTIKSKDKTQRMYLQDGSYVGTSACTCSASKISTQEEADALYRIMLPDMGTPVELVESESC